MARETVRIEGLDTLLDRLRRLGPEASKRGGPVRRAVRKGAVIIANEANVMISAAVMGRLKADLFQRGLLPFVADNRIHVVPPCPVTADEVAEAIDIYDAAFSAVL